MGHWRHITRMLITDHAIWEALTSSSRSCIRIATNSRLSSLALFHNINLQALERKANSACLSFRFLVVVRA